MTPTPTERAAFLAALRAVSRTACDRYATDRAARGTPAFEQAKAAYRSLPLLAAPALRDLALAALRSSCGAAEGPETPLAVTVWPGMYAVDGGSPCETTLVGFVDWLREQAEHVAAKGNGWVACPTRNRDGKRENASTLAMTALSLDCDSRGGWETLLHAVSALGLAFVAYQSGGWTAAAPKWHVLFLLAQPFDTSSPEKIAAWKSAYAVCRVVFGALGSLTGEGFDPACETPCQPVFVTEKRHKDDAARRVVWRPGARLDLDKLLATLPVTDAEAEAATRSLRVPDVSSSPLSDVRLESITETLSAAMADILSDRRDLYLALSSALLDRGVPPNDMRLLIEEVSLRCPGDPQYTKMEVASKHREHLHAADTSIAKWESDVPVTRIGTIVERWPEVALALDAAFPEYVAARVREAEEAIDRLTDQLGAPRRAPASVQQTSTSSAPIVAPIDLHALRKRLIALRRKKRAAAGHDNVIRAAILGALLDGEDIAVYDGDALAERRDGKPVDRDTALAMAMGMVAYGLPTETPFEAVAEVVRPALFASLKSGETLPALFQKAEHAFLRSLKSRLEQAEAEFLRAAQARKDRAL